MKGATPPPAADTPEVVTVAVTMPLALYRRVLAMEYYDSRNARLDVSAAAVEQMEGAVKCWLETTERHDPQPEEYLALFEQELAAGLYSTVYPPRLAVQLDPVAAEMLQRVVRQGNDCREPGDDPRDLVNAAVTFYLSSGDDAQHGEFNLEAGDEALARAMGDRLASEQKGGA